jgi:hypothetical protein
VEQVEQKPGRQFNARNAVAIQTSKPKAPESISPTRPLFASSTEVGKHSPSTPCLSASEPLQM